MTSRNPARLALALAGLVALLVPRTTLADPLAIGADNYLLTGDGQEQHAQLVTHAPGAPGAAGGPGALEVRTTADAGHGTHWKLMLFANGNAAAYDGIDLSDYDRLVFHAKASRPVTLLGGVGTGDDSGSKGLPALALTTEYQRFELDLTGVDLTDINTFLWVYLHKDVNPFDYTGVSVFIDNVRFERNDTFVTQDATYTVGPHIDDTGNFVHTEVLFDSSSSYLTPLSSSGDVATTWVVDRSIMHNQGGPLLLDTVALAGWYVQDCGTGEWVSIYDTVYAPLGDSLQIIDFNRTFDVRHGYGNIVTNGLLDAQFACPRDPPGFEDVLLDGTVHTVPSVGRVHYAVVIEHR